MDPGSTPTHREPQHNQTSHTLFRDNIDRARATAGVESWYTGRMIQYISRLHHSACPLSPTYTETELGTSHIRHCTYPDYEESHQYGLWQTYRLFLYITNPDNSHWILHGMFRLGHAAITVHIDSFNGKQEYFKAPLQHHLQWMTTAIRPPDTLRETTQDQFLHIEVPEQRNNHMCGSCALCSHKLLVEHAQTLTIYPVLNTNEFAKRLQHDLKELLKTVTVTYTTNYRKWTNEQIIRGNPTPTQVYPLFPRQPPTDHHEQAQPTEPQWTQKAKQIHG